MNNLQLLTIFLTLGNGIIGLLNKPYFEIEIQSVEQIAANLEITDFSQLKIRKINGTRCIVGDVFYYKQVDDLQAEYLAFKKQGGDYKIMPYRVPLKNFCDFFAEDTIIYPELAKASTFPEDIRAHCPFKPQTFTLNGLYPTFDQVPKAVAPSGDYAAELKIYDGKKDIVLHWRVYARIHNI